MSPQDEAYELGCQWAQYYESGSPSRKLITQIMDTYLLVNIVHNDFKKPDALYEPFFKAGAECAAAAQEAEEYQPALLAKNRPNGRFTGLANGYTNGHAN